jgi:thiamine biosynthesis protein ThiI
VPRRPATAAGLEAIQAEEARLSPAVLERAVDARRIYDLRSLAAEDLALPELEIGDIPPGATVIDLRDRAAFDGWHWEGALRLDFAHALDAYPSFERGRTFVLYCDYGLMSAHLAELMRKDGFDAFHVRGGTRTLKLKSG